MDEIRKEFDEAFRVLSTFSAGQKPGLTQILLFLLWKDQRIAIASQMQPQAAPAIETEVVEENGHGEEAF